MVQSDAKSTGSQMKVVGKTAKSLKMVQFHNNQKPDGTPNAHAAGIIDGQLGRYKQAEAAALWKALGKALGEVAKKRGRIRTEIGAGFRDWAHVQPLANSDLAKVKPDSGL